MRALFCATVAVLIPACAAAHPPAPAPAASLETIRFEATRCNGRCPVFVIEARSDGAARFEGIDHTAARGIRDFTITPQQFADYQARLAPNRPVGERLLDKANCPTEAATDMPSIDVRWSGAGRDDRLLLYIGCEPERNADLFEAVGRAPEALGITAWVRGE